MVQTISRFGLERHIGDLVTIRRGNRDIHGRLRYGGDKGIGDGFLVPVGTGKFYVSANNARHFGVDSGGYNERGTTYNINLRDKELIKVFIHAPLEHENLCDERVYRVKL